MEYVRLVEIAKVFGIDKSNVRKYLLSKGFVFLKKRFEETRNQMNLCLSKEDFEKAKKMRVADEFKLNY